MPYKLVIDPLTHALTDIFQVMPFT